MIDNDKYLICSSISSKVFFVDCELTSSTEIAFDSEDGKGVQCEDKIAVVLGSSKIYRYESGKFKVIMQFEAEINIIKIDHNENKDNYLILTVNNDNIYILYDVLIEDGKEGTIIKQTIIGRRSFEALDKVHFVDKKDKLSIITFDNSICHFINVYYAQYIEGPYDCRDLFGVPNEELKVIKIEEIHYRERLFMYLYENTAQKLFYYGIGYLPGGRIQAIKLIEGKSEEKIDNIFFNDIDSNLLLYQNRNINQSFLLTECTNGLLQKDESSNTLKCVDQCLNDYININNVYCSSQCDSSFFYEQTLNQCYDCFENEKQFIYNGNCIKECPEGYSIGKARQCIQCSVSNPYIDKETNTCTDNCDYGNILDDNKKYCISCNEKGLVEYKGDCITQCPPKYQNVNGKCNKCQLNWYNDQCVDECPDNTIEVNGICNNCENDEKYFEGQCVKECPIYYMNNNGICEKCGEEQYYYKGICYDKCPFPLFADNEKGDKICINCVDSNQYYSEDDKGCVSTCNYLQGYYLYENNQCVKCKEKSLYVYDNTCINECPEGYYKIEKETNKCLSCTEYGKIIFPEKKQCVDECNEDGYILDKSTNRCLSCADMNYYLYESTCVSECPASLGYVPINNECILCSSIGKVYYDNQCISSCPYRTISKAGQCLSCEDAGLFIYGSQCVEKCPDLFILKPEINTCVPCKEMGMYTLDKKCVPKCPISYTFEKITYQCMTCKEAGAYNHRGECVQNCPSGTTLIPSSSSCIDCNSGKYFNTVSNECVPINLCDSSKLIINNELMTCYPCENDKYIYNNQCYDNCKDINLCVDNIKKKCVYCNECQEKEMFRYQDSCFESCPSSTFPQLGECKACKELSLYDVSGRCVEKCPDNYISTINNVCVPCSLFFNSVCVTECPTNNIAINNNCERCPSSSPLYYNGKCVSECPPNTENDNNVKCILTPGLLSNCNGNGIYNSDKGVCECNDNYFGEFCNFKYSTQNIKPKIISLDEVYAIFGYDMIEEGSGEYEITWSINGDLYLPIEVNPNGNKQNQFKIAISSLKDSNEIKLTINDIGKEKVTYEGQITFSLDIPKENDFACNVAYYQNGRKVEYGTAMKTIVEISLINSTAIDNYLFKFAYEDFNGFIISLTKYDTITNFISNKFAETGMIYVYVKSFSGIIKKISCPVDIRRNGHLALEKPEKFIEEIKSGNITELQRTATLLDGYILDNHVFQFLISLLLKSEVKEHQAISKIYKKLIEYKDGEHINEMSKVMNNITKRLLDNGNDITITVNDIKSYLTVIDSTYEIIKYKNSSLSSEENSKDIKTALSNLLLYISKKLSPNEKIVVNSRHIVSYIARPSPSTKKITFPDINPSSISSYNSLDPSSDQEESECDNSELLCIDPSSISKLSLYASTSTRRLTSSISSLNDVSVCVSKYARNTSDTQLSDSSVHVKIANPDSFFLPETSYSVTQKTNVTIPDNSSCIDLTSVSHESIKCKTYFNYTSERVICKCTGEADITNIMDYAMTQLSKLFQFSEPKIEKLNTLSLSIIYVTLSVVIIFSILLSLIDLYDDKRLIKMNDKKDVVIIKQEFKALSPFEGIGIFGFASFITMYSYPFFGVFVLYKFDQPRFLRFLIEVINILLNLIFTLFPYYKVDFEDKIKFVNERDIDTINFSIENLPVKLITMCQTIIYSIISAIIISILMAIFLSILQWNKFLEKAWKNKKKRIELFIRAYMVKPLLEKKPEVTKKILTRFAALSIFENKLLQINFEKKTKKTSLSSGKEIEMISIDSNTNDSSLKEKLTPQINNNLINMNDIDIGGNEKNILIPIDPKLKITYPIRLSLNEASAARKKKLNLFYFLNQKKYLSVFFNFQKKEVTNGYKNYILREAHFESFTVPAIKRNQISDKTLKHDRFKLLKYSFLVSMTFIVYSVIFYFFVIVSYNVYSNYHLYIIKAWLMPCLLQLFVVGVLLEFILNLFYGIMCFKFYNRRKKNLLMKILFFIVSKEKIYMYKIRNFITKYKERFFSLENAKWKKQSVILIN